MQAVDKPFKRILCAVEFGSAADHAIGLARRIAQLSGGVIYLLHVAAIPHQAMDSPVPIEDDPPWENRARGELQRLARSLLPDVSYQVQIESGLPAPTILRIAAALPADLIVMATHGRSGLEHFLLGSVTERVIRESLCPVISVRPV